MKSYRKAIGTILAVTLLLYLICFAYYWLVLGQWPDGGIDLGLLWVPALACFFSLVALLAVSDSRRPNMNKLALRFLAVMMPIFAVTLVVGITIERTVHTVQRIGRERRTAGHQQVINGILEHVLPVAAFAPTREPSADIQLPLLVMEWDKNTNSYRDGYLAGLPSGYDPPFPRDPEATYRECTVVLVKETGRRQVSEYYETTLEAHERRVSAAVERMTQAQEDERLRQLTGGAYNRVETELPGLPKEEPGPSGPPSGRGERVELSVCLVTWPGKQVIGTKTFSGLPPSTTYFSPNTPILERVADGTEEAEKAISRWIEQAVKKN